MQLDSDSTLKKALYELYVALFNAKKTCPDYFSDGRITTIQTAIMGIENVGWRVVGITREALDLLATEDFNKNKLPRRLCRGHIVDRIKTTRDLFSMDESMELDDFFKFFLANDLTVIMLNEQNHIMPFPKFIEIENPDADLFPNGSLMSWKHRAKEREFLRQLHAALLEGEPCEVPLVLESELKELEREFHTLIQSRLEEFQVTLPKELPRLEGLMATKENPAWFDVDGMYGGFAYYLLPSKAPAKLIVES